MLMLMPGLEQSTTNQVGCCCRCPLPKDFTCTSHTHTQRETDKDTPGHTQIQNGRRLAQVCELCNLYLCFSHSFPLWLSVCLCCSLRLIESLEYATSRMHFATFPLFHSSTFPYFPLLMKNRPHHNIVRSSHCAGTGEDEDGGRRGARHRRVGFMI